MFLYIDGEVDIEHDTTGVFGVAGVDVHLGGTPAERRALRLMDEIGVFNVPLEQADIQNLMDNGLSSVLGLTPDVDGIVNVDDCNNILR